MKDHSVSTSAPEPSHLGGLRKVHGLLGRLVDDARERPDELRQVRRWKEVYDAIDELRQGNPPHWLRTACRVVQLALDEVRPVMMREPLHPGYLREMLRAFARLTRIVEDVRDGRVK